MYSIAKQLKTLRTERELTLAQVAYAVGISTSAYSNYEQGIRQPSLDIIKSLCKFFEVSSDYLLGLED